MLYSKLTGGPLLNKIDPRSKLLFVLLLSFPVFLIDKFPAAVCLLLSLIVFRMAAKIHFSGFKYIRNLSLLAVFIIFMQTLLGNGENFIVKPLFPPSFPLLGGAGSLKWEGLVFGLVIVCRLFALLLILPVLTETTPLEKIARALCSFGFNYRTAFIFTAAFNMIPLFEEEGRLLMDAQRLRGMRSFEPRSSFFAKMKAYPGLVVPLVLGAMRKAKSSSVAMDSRAFGVYKTRTWLEKPRMKVYDFIFIAFSLVFTAGILFFNFFCMVFMCPAVS
jgi:energy-coupling factor transport system permease protein